MEIYTSKFIKINAIPDLVAFVQAAQKVDGDVLVKRGKWCISASSLMGMMSIDVSDGVTVEYPVDAKAFGEYLDATFGA